MLENGILNGFVGEPFRCCGETVDLQRDAVGGLGEGRYEAVACMGDVGVGVEPHFHVGAEATEVGVDRAVDQSCGIIVIGGFPFGLLLHLYGYPMLHQRYLLEILKHLRCAGEHTVGVDVIAALNASGAALLHRAVVGETSAYERVGGKVGGGLVPVYHFY